MADQHELWASSRLLDSTLTRLGRPLDDEVARPRLVEQLRRRWTTPLVLVEAPGGYGKSTVLAQAIRDNVTDPVGVDVYLSCSPGDRDATVLAGRLLDQLGTDPAGLRADTLELADRVVAALARHATTEISLVLDDLHRLDADDDAVAMLAHLVRSLPANTHLVLAGRSLPPLPLARLIAGDDIVRMGPAELAFDPAETATLAERHGVPPGDLEPVAGWAALTRLALVVGRAAQIDYLAEEVIDPLDRSQREALALAALAGHLDDDLLRAAGCDVGSANAAIDVLPLVTRYADGRIVAHDLWLDVVDRLVEPERLRQLAAAVCRRLAADGRPDEALRAASAAGAWEDAKAVVMRALEGNDATQTAARLRRWHAVFPANLHEAPELRLLRGISTRMARGAGAGDADIEAALTGFRELGLLQEQATAGIEVGLCAWMRGDVARVLDMVTLSDDLAAAGVHGMAPLAAMARYAVADLEGRPDRALAELETIDVDDLHPGMAFLVLRAQSTLNFLLGRSAAGVASAEELVRRESSAPHRFILDIARWQHGDPTGLLTSGVDRHALRADNTRDDFLARVFNAMIDAGFGIAPDLAGLAQSDTGRSREQTFVAITAAAALVTAGDETGASARLEAHLDDVSVDDPLCRGELRRFVPYGYLLSERARAALDADDLGPKLAERRAIARLLVAARAGSAVDWGSLPAAAEVFCALPLRWSVELAARAACEGDDAGVEVAEYLIDTIGPPAFELMRELAASTGPVATGAAAVLRTIPAAPEAPVQIRAFGPLEVTTVGEADPVLRRRRVRELLGLLVLHDRVTADQAMSLLWPDLAIRSARNNLRITLSMLRKLLEPDRRSGEAPYLVRRRGDVLWLHRGPHLEVDLWDARHRLAQGRRLEEAGRLPDAVEEYRRSVRQWRGPLFEDLRYHDALAPDVTQVELELATAAELVGEWLLTRGDGAEARSIAERVLRHDPYSERAHRVVINALLSAGRIDAAADAIAACRRALGELGVEPAEETTMLMRRLTRDPPAAG